MTLAESFGTEEIHQTLNPRLDCLGVAGTFYKKTGNHQADMMNWLRSQFAGHGDDEGAEDLVFRTAIRDNTHIGESHGFQMPVTHYVRERCRGDSLSNAKPPPECPISRRPSGYASHSSAPAPWCCRLGGSA